MTKPQELTTDTRLVSPRASEGTVTVICDYGQCEHDTSRTESVHVRGAHYSTLFGAYTSDWFINLPSNYDIEEWGASLA